MQLIFFFKCFFNPTVELEKRLLFEHVGEGFKAAAAVAKMFKGAKKEVD